ncbi:hypothetical protein SK128_025888, partial [Halocaridina rubra]
MCESITSSETSSRRTSVSSAHLSPSLDTQVECKNSSRFSNPSTSVPSCPETTILNPNTLLRCHENVPSKHKKAPPPKRSKVGVKTKSNLKIPYIPVEKIEEQGSIITVDKTSVEYMRERKSHKSSDTFSMKFIDAPKVLKNEISKSFVVDPLDYLEECDLQSNNVSKLQEEHRILNRNPQLGDVTYPVSNFGYSAPLEERKIWPSNVNNHQDSSITDFCKGKDNRTLHNKNSRGDTIENIYLNSVHSDSCVTNHGALPGHENCPPVMNFKSDFITSNETSYNIPASNLARWTYSDQNDPDLSRHGENSNMTLYGKLMSNASNDVSVVASHTFRERPHSMSCQYVCTDCSSGTNMVLNQTKSPSLYSVNFPEGKCSNNSTFQSCFHKNCRKITKIQGSPPDCFDKNLR